MKYLLLFLLCVLFENLFAIDEKVDSLKAQLEKQKEDTSDVWVLNELGKHYLRINPLQARSYFEEGIVLSEQNNFLAGKIELLKNKGTSFYYAGVLDSTAHYWRKSLKLTPYTQIEKKADACNNMGVFFTQTGNPDSALYYHSASLRLKSIEGDSVRIAASISNLAALYRQIGAYENAFDYYFQALDIYDKNGMLDEKSDALNGIGLIYKGLKDYEFALDYLNQSLEIRKQLQDVRAIASSINNIATIYQDMDEHQKAEENYLIYLELSEKMNDLKGIAGAYSNLGGVYKSQNQLDLSIRYYQNAYERFEKLKDEQNIGLVSTNIGHLLNRKNEPKKAMVYLKTALNYAKIHQSLDYQKSIYEGLIKSYNALGNYESALNATNEWINIKDSIFNNGLKDKIAFYQEQYQAEKSTNEILNLKNEALENEKVISENKVAKNKAILITIFSLLASVILFSMYWFRKKIHEKDQRIAAQEKQDFQRKDELKTLEIDSKNRELSALATNAVQKNEMLGKLNEKIKSLKTTNQNLSDLEHLVNDGLNLDGDWNTFSRHFLSVHPNFFEKINEKNKKLSSNDLRICAYIKMNLSTKEIAILMNITPKSVRMNLYRLKKKLELEETEEVRVFISQLN